MKSKSTSSIKLSWFYWSSFRHVSSTTVKVFKNRQGRIVENSVLIHTIFSLISMSLKDCIEISEQMVCINTEFSRILL